MRKDQDHYRDAVRKASDLASMGVEGFERLTNLLLVIERLTKAGDTASVGIIVSEAGFVAREYLDLFDQGEQELRPALAEVSHA